MGRFKRWLCERYLPAYCHDAVLADNKALAERVETLEAENLRLRAYVSGMETAIRRGRPQIIVKGGEVSRK